MLESTKDTRCIPGTPPCLITAAWAVTGQFTKQTLSLRKHLTKMRASVSRHPFVGGFQESNQTFLTLSGAQGVTMSVCSFVRSWFV